MLYVVIFGTDRARIPGMGSDAVNDTVWMNPFPNSAETTGLDRPPVFAFEIIMCWLNRSAFSALVTTSLSLLFFGAICGVACAESPVPEVRVVELEIVDGKVTGQNVIRVIQGQRVELHWSTDEPLDIHLHGYNIEKSLESNADNAMQFDVHATGRFPVTVHEHSIKSDGHERATEQAHGERVLIYLEVYPE